MAKKNKKLEYRTCNKCSWVHFRISRKNATVEVSNFNQYFDTLTKEQQQEYYRGEKSSIIQYERCNYCGNSFMDFRSSLNEEIPHGSTIGPIIYESAVDNKIGKKFNRLTVVSFSHSERFKRKNGHMNSRSWWNCLCECGVTVKVRSDGLANGNSKSCGCLQKEELKKIQEDNKKPSGQAYLTSVYNQYKYRAKVACLEFTLTKQEVYSVIIKKCSYCGSPPEQDRNSSHRYNGSFKHNGIDRVDNNIGYVISNCAPSCTKCNFMKLQLGRDEFLNHIHKIDQYSNKDKK